MGLTSAGMLENELKKGDVSDANKPNKTDNHTHARLTSADQFFDWFV